MNNSYKGTERRGSKRVKAEFIITYKVNKTVEFHMWIGDSEIKAKMLDLSEKGMSIFTKYNLTKFTILLMKFTLINLHPGSDSRVRSMEITGVVKNSVFTDEKQYRLGISFKKISESDKQAIAKFVEAESRSQ
jgi:c-di-GMP-binding flagellar brake protein YcgR